MPEVTTSSRGYKQEDITINSCHTMFIMVYIILNYGFLYSLNLCIEFMYRISSNSFRGIYSFQVLPAAATKRGRLLNEGGY